MTIIISIILLAIFWRLFAALIVGGLSLIFVLIVIAAMFGGLAV